MVGGRQFRCTGAATSVLVDFEVVDDLPQARGSGLLDCPECLCCDVAVLYYRPILDSGWVAVAKGDLGLASGDRPDGTYDQVWFKELVSPDEVTFEARVFLLTKARAHALKQQPEPSVGKPVEVEEIHPEGELKPETEKTGKEPEAPAVKRTIRVSGQIPPEVWNRLGTRLIPKLRSGLNLQLRIEATVDADASSVPNLKKELDQAMSDLGLSDRVDVDLK